MSTTIDGNVLTVVLRLIKKNIKRQRMKRKYHKTTLRSAKILYKLKQALQSE